MDVDDISPPASSHESESDNAVDNPSQCSSIPATNVIVVDDNEVAGPSHRIQRAVRNPRKCKQTAPIIDFPDTESDSSSDEAQNKKGNVQLKKSITIPKPKTQVLKQTTTKKKNGKKGRTNLTATKVTVKRLCKLKWLSADEADDAKQQ